MVHILAGYMGRRSSSGYGGYGGYGGYAGYGSNGNMNGGGIFTGGYLGMSSIRPSRGYRRYSHKISPLRPAGRPGNNFGIRLSDDDDDDFDSGFLGQSVRPATGSSAGVRPNIRPIVKKTSNIRPLGNVGGPVIRPQPSFDTDEDEFDRGVLGPAVVRQTSGRSIVRPVDKKIYKRKLSSARGQGGNIGGGAVTLPATSFDDDLDDFDNGILGSSVGGSNGRPISSRPVFRPISRQGPSPLRTSGSLGASPLSLRPSFDDNDDDDDFNRGILGAGVRGPRGRGSFFRRPLFQPSFDNDDFGSVPVFSRKPVYGGGYGGYPRHGYNYHGSSNSYATGYNGGIGGYGSGNWYGGGFGNGGGGFGIGGGGFAGRFNFRGGVRGRGGRGGGSSGGSGGGGDSDDNDFDDDNDSGTFRTFMYICYLNPGIIANPSKKSSFLTVRRFGT